MRFFASRHARKVALARCKQCLCLQPNPARNLVLFQMHGRKLHFEKDHKRTRQSQLKPQFVVAGTKSDLLHIIFFSNWHAGNNDLNKPMTSALSSSWHARNLLLLRKMQEIILPISLFTLSWALKPVPNWINHAQRQRPGGGLAWSLATMQNISPNKFCNTQRNRFMLNNSNVVMDEACTVQSPF